MQMPLFASFKVLQHDTHAEREREVLLSSRSFSSMS